MLVDVLDASNGSPGFVFVNIAPRNGEASEKWENGSPFGYLRYGDTRILATVDGYTLTLVRDILGLDWCTIFNIPEVVNIGVQQGFISKPSARDIPLSQFRSFDFLPRLAQLIVHEVALPTTQYSLCGAPSAFGRIWLLDNFGNAKTTLRPDQVDFNPGEKVLLAMGEVRCYCGLRQVSNGEPGLIIGSSGLEGQRFLELVIQGGSAARHFNLEVGSIVCNIPTPQGVSQ